MPEETESDRTRVTIVKELLCNCMKRASDYPISRPDFGFDLRLKFTIIHLDVSNCVAEVVLGHLMS